MPNHPDACRAHTFYCSMSYLFKRGKSKYVDDEADASGSEDEVEEKPTAEDEAFIASDGDMSGDEDFDHGALHVRTMQSPEKHKFKLKGKKKRAVESSDESEAESDAESEAESEAESDAESDAESKAESKAESEAESDSDVESVASAMSKQKKGKSKGKKSQAAASPASTASEDGSESSPAVGSKRKAKESKSKEGQGSAKKQAKEKSVKHSLAASILKSTLGGGGSPSKEMPPGTILQAYISPTVFTHASAGDTSVYVTRKNIIVGVVVSSKAASQKITMKQSITFGPGMEELSPYGVAGTEAVAFNILKPQKLQKLLKEFGDSTILLRVMEDKLIFEGDGMLLSYNMEHMGFRNAGRQWSVDASTAEKIWSMMHELDQLHTKAPSKIVELTDKETRTVLQRIMCVESLEKNSSVVVDLTTAACWDAPGYKASVEDAELRKLLKGGRVEERHHQLFKDVLILGHDLPGDLTDEEARWLAAMQNEVTCTFMMRAAMEMESMGQVSATVGHSKYKGKNKGMSSDEARRKLEHLVGGDSTRCPVGFDPYPGASVHTHKVLGSFLKNAMQSRLSPGIVMVLYDFITLFKSTLKGVSMEWVVTNVQED